MKVYRSFKRTNSGDEYLKSSQNVIGRSERGGTTQQGNGTTGPSRSFCYETLIEPRVRYKRQNYGFGRVCYLREMYFDTRILDKVEGG